MMSKRADLFNGMEKSVIILDGGLGTTLESISKTQIANTPLWSAEALSKDPEAIVAAHLAYLQAGAQIIETSTYQCSLDTFQRAGYNIDTAKQLMHRAISLAQKARSIFDTQRAAIQQSTAQPPIRICLSLGPFGASLSPTQEFEGFYPPPYEPRGYSTESMNSNYFDEDSEEEKAIQALAAFHFERLMMFAEDKGTWSCIDMIAFETVPLAREAIAIRRTMAKFEDENRDNGMGKAWWISFVLPEGRCPQMTDTDGERLTASELVWASLSPNLLGGREDEDIGVPDGLGINCTSVEYLPRIVDEMGLACMKIEREERPFLVLYPNGGDEYDRVHGVWKTGDREKRGEWATRLAGVVERVCRGCIWGGVVVGGCCQCSAEQIAELVNNM
ncbi:hypothetical protein AGABI2DRAFT_185360 [Agaricus bisporus var. bisporus H97]|uniref:hypothetical protein n=1 Tax=Agaricus bisporus var. bisporus (strain H97 / ATCC MYA-4626 / FGSC 10389) TaxID=936046 RepID=UPI00029F5287|nr:hypothetical protein AGABI2DRAFT_185360 [Agaricus bisporus var. bisporus H97]EKV47413.1 hypothetical protein AGABI2DRAFT_185360 [Agaricus bisporus var. bisporus H97]